MNETFDKPQSEVCSISACGLYKQSLLFPSPSLKGMHYEVKEARRIEPIKKFSCWSFFLETFVLCVRETLAYSESSLFQAFLLES